MAKFSFKKSLPAPEISENQWQDWTWQLRNSLKSQQDFQKYFVLSESEKAGFAAGKEIFNIRTTPYYASLAGSHEHDPLRRIFMPRQEELELGNQQMLDPLGEKRNQATSRLIHRYSDRVLFLITDICSVYCRFCTRKHFTGADQAMIKTEEYNQSLEYIRARPGIREVILSGGDPLTLSDAHLDRVLFDLRQISHIEIIRIGSRIPVVAPQRITEDLSQLLRKYKPVFLMTHFNHPREITEEAAIAIETLVDHGNPVMNQMVLLNGVNNHAAIVQALSRRLLFLRAKPYYMFQCDPSIGTDHLRNSIEDSLSIQKELWGHLSGLAMPNYAVDIPNGGGKTVLTPNFQLSTDLENESQGVTRSYRGWDGIEADYVSPDLEKIIKPLDYEDYLDEWNEIKTSRQER
ncbi:MAG: KamA family radical SAM protein [Bdellovibrionota bacterium]